MSRRPLRSVVWFAALTLVACTPDLDSTGEGSGDPLAPELAAARSGGQVRAVTDREIAAGIRSALMDLGGEAQRRASRVRSDVALHGIWWTGRVEDRTMGGFVYFSDRGNKRLPVQWVPGDERRNGRTDLAYAVGVPLAGFPTLDAPGVPAAAVEAAIDRAMDTWDDERCSRGLDIEKRTFFDWLVFDADILHAWFQPLPAGVIGVTLPFVFVDGEGEPTDVDGDGAMDYAFAQILYGTDFPWGIDGLVDVESIALHEAGHGLGQGHFGAAFETLANGKIHFAPRSVMNAGYTGVQQSLTGTDRAGHCGIYGSWPNG